MLTKEQIESMHTLLVRERPMGTSVAAVDELCRLALLGLERDERAEELRVNVGIAITLFASELGCAPTSGDILAAIESLKAARDERAEKIGRAVMSALGNANVRDLRAWAQDLHEDSSGGWSHRGAIFDAIATALEAP